LKIAITSDPFIPVPPVNYGGIERIIDFLADGLSKKGHEIVLVAHADSKVNVPLIKYPPLKEGITGHISNVWTINKLKGWKPDLIHSFSRLAYLLPFLGSDVPKLMSYQREPTISQVKKTVKLSKKNTLAFTGCSSYISDQIKPFASSFTVYNGVDLEKYKFQPCVEDDAPLMFLGRIEPVKGTHIAVEAARTTGRKLIIAGNIPTEHKAYFEEKVKPYLDERIEYTGPVNDIQKNELLGKAAAFLMPIEWDEPFGIVMAEALACGTPVIGYKRGAVPEVVAHGVNGFIADDFNSLCSYILKSKTLSRVAARASAEEHFSSEVIIDSYLDVYQTLINKN
jgi:glycosyltransferase involved in cell wall biosynthesis